MNKTKIEYLNFTWNPEVGCSGEGCAVRAHCWARAMAKRQKQRCADCYNFVPHFHPERLSEPLHRRKPAKIGVSFMGELFDSDIAKRYIDPRNLRPKFGDSSHSFYKYDSELNVIRKGFWHTFLMLTKQPQNIPLVEFPENLWIGVTVNIKDDLWRIKKLKETTTKTKFVSFEPLYEDLGEIDLEGIHWVIIGAQTKPLWKPDIAWVQKIMERAHSVNAKVFIKNNVGWSEKIQEFPQFFG